MKLQQHLLNDYLRTEFENFSHRAVLALGLLISIKHNPISDLNQEKKDALDTAIKDVEEIISITNKETQISLFVLDRNIAPQDFSKTATIQKINFERKKKIKDTMRVQLNSDQIQDLLCNASLQIHKIVMTQISGFSDQMFLENSW